MSEIEPTLELEVGNIDDKAIRAYIEYCLSEGSLDIPQESIDELSEYFPKSIESLVNSKNSITVIGVMAGEDVNNPVFVLEKTSDVNIVVTYLTSHNYGEFLEMAKEELINEFGSVREAEMLAEKMFSDLDKMAELMVKWRKKSDFRSGYADYEKELEATTKALYQAFFAVFSGKIDDEV